MNFSALLPQLADQLARLVDGDAARHADEDDFSHQLHGVFNGDDFSFWRIDALEGGVQSRRLAASCRSCRHGERDAHPLSGRDVEGRFGHHDGGGQAGSEREGRRSKMGLPPPMERMFPQQWLRRDIAGIRIVMVGETSKEWLERIADSLTSQVASGR